MIEIDAGDDPRLAEYRSLHNPNSLVRAGLFVVEGRRVLRRLLALPRYRVHSLLVTQAAAEALGDALASLEPLVPVYVVDQMVMNTIAGFQIHRGCLALVERPRKLRPEDLDLSNANRLVVLEGVNNPDNIGGIFRSAAAFDVAAVILGPNCGDPLYRKAIRTSMGGSLQVAFASAQSCPDAVHSLRAQGFRVLALTPSRDARPLNDLPRDLARVALLVGAEGDGLSAEAIAAADERVRIPMPGSAESLNVMVATSIALYHFGR